MRSTYILPGALALAIIGVLGDDMITVTAPAALLARDTGLPCNLNPSSGLPPLCLSDFGPFNPSAGTKPTTTGPSKTTNPGSGPQTTAPPKATGAPAPSCSLQRADPDEGIDTAYCVCEKTKTLPIKSYSTPIGVDESCAYKSIPNTGAVTPTVDLPPPTTNTKLCQVCTRVVNNEDDCNTIPNCLPQAAAATVQAGSSPVHVGTLTGEALYTSVSSALEKICPPVTQTTSKTACSTDTVAIPDIDYVEGGFLATDGELVVQVDSSAYNVTSLRSAMIHSAALSAKNSAQGKNCYDQSYEVESLKKRDTSSLGRFRDWTASKIGLVERDHPYPQQEHQTMCNVAEFAGVQYYSQFWRLAPEPGATDYIDARWSFHTGPGGDFACDFLEALADALVVVAPEFAVGEVELGEAVGTVCRDSMNED
ncbi:MAG: hypothetical protein M4579_002047 [Chaenotheca gracillima]|nr:MAG: hypothetical protein M4579_002047 [Chaenotheca gracillima]